MNNSKNLTNIIKILTILLLVIAILYLDSVTFKFVDNILTFISALVTPFVIAFFLNFLLYPVVKKLEKMGLRIRWINIIIVYILFFAIVGGILVLIIPLITAQIVNLISQIPEILDYVAEILKDIDYATGVDNGSEANLDYLINWVTEKLDLTKEDIQSYILTFLAGFSKSISVIFSTVLTIVLSPIILFFMLKDGDELKSGFVSFFPKKLQHHIDEVLDRLNVTIGLYVRGQLIIMIGIGVISFIGYSLLGMKYALLFGLIVGLTNIIPYIGAMIAAVIPIAFSFFDPNVEWYQVIALNFIFQFIEGNLLQPLIMSKQIDVHPLVIIIAILGFGSILGTVGVIFAVPLTGIIKVIYLYVKEVNSNDEAIACN